MADTKNVKKTISVNKTKSIKPAQYAATTSIVNKDAEAKEKHAKKHNLKKSTKIALLTILIALPILIAVLVLVLVFALPAKK